MKQGSGCCVENRPLRSKSGEQKTIVAIQVRDDGRLDLNSRNGGGKKYADSG